MTRSTRSGSHARVTDKPKAKRPKSPLMSERGERQSQVTLQMRESLHRELTRRAFESGMTLRGYILNALRKNGLKVTEADLVDRRRRE
jgi:hypothetical protein